LPVLWVSGAENRRFTLFFYSPWTFFARNVAKVYRAGAICPGILPRNHDEVRKNASVQKIGIISGHQ
jgi:hypothetical protein